VNSPTPSGVPSGEANENTKQWEVLLNFSGASGLLGFWVLGFSGAWGTDRGSTTAMGPPVLELNQILVRAVVAVQLQALVGLHPAWALYARKKQ
jgi:hypothetical protein